MSAKKKSAPKPKVEALVPPVEEPVVVESTVPSCDNHPDRESVWSSDGVKASVIHLCGDCRSRGGL